MDHDTTFYVERTETGLYIPICKKAAVCDIFQKGYSYCELYNGDKTIILLFWSLYYPAPKQEALDAIEEYFKFVYALTGNKGSLANRGRD